MITKAEIEIARSPFELRAFVTDVRARLEADRGERRQAYRKNGIYKMFFDEVIPLALAADHICGASDKLMPISGNQGYDIVVLDEGGTEIGRVEIAKPFDGRADAEDRKLLLERGYGEVHVGNLGDDLEKIADIIVRTAEEKSNKDYGDCILLIVGVTSPPFECERLLLEQSANSLCERLMNIHYIARKVIFVVPLLDRCYVIQG